MKRLILLVLGGFLLTTGVTAQELAVKTNLLYDATTTGNIGVEAGLSKKWTLDVSGNLNPWTFSNNKKIKHWMVQPEARYWLCEKFNGSFFGIHAHGGQFNVSDWDFPIALKALKDKRYEGWFYGAGVSYGYQWVMSRRWNLEMNAGAGYARVHYNKYPCSVCGSKLAEGNYNYWGVTKAAISLIYFLK